MSEQPRVSVIIPVYNTEKYLRECLDSVVNQTLRDIEIICVDDGSEDTSANIISEYAERDARVKTIYYPINKTASQARKDGVMLAKGKYIMFMDSDDSLELCACEELSAEMDRRGVDMLQFGTFVDASSYVRPETVANMKRFTTPCTRLMEGKGEVFRACFEEEKFRFNLWNKIYKAGLCKRAFAEVEDGAFPKAQDLYAFFILAWYAESYYGIEKKYYHYKYGRGITGGGRTVSMKTFLRHCSQYTVGQKCKEFLKQRNAWEEWETVWEKVNRGLANECVGTWLRWLSSEECGAGFDALADRWGLEYIAGLIKARYANQLGQVYVKTVGSRYPVAKAMEWDVLEPEDATIPNGFERLIPIVFAVNDSYAPYAGVAIQSILEHVSRKNYYRVYVLHTNISSYHMQTLERLGTDQLSVKCINVNHIIQSKETELHERAHYTKEMYYRLIIPEVLYCFPFAIYLDADLIVNADVADMIPKDIGGRLIAAIRNYMLPSKAERLYRLLQLDAEKYFNSGVLVINIQQWQKEHIVERCFELIKKIPRQNLEFPDQDILNVVCQDRVCYLGAEWNYAWHMLYGVQEFVELCKPVTERVGENFRILHFASGLKPWNMPEIPHARYFWEYARRSPFYEEILKKNFVTSLKKERQEISAIRASWSYRIGRAITWLPRKIRGGIRCYQEHGLRYTLERLKAHFTGEK